MEDPYQSYIKSVTRHPLLSKEEEKALTLEYSKSKNDKIKTKLINSNLRLVIKIAMSYKKSGMPNLDLIQEGNIGLIKGVENYNPTLGVPLGNYAALWIRAYMLKYIVSNHRLVKLGTTEAQRKLFFNLQKERNALAAQGIEVTNEELANKFDLSEGEVESMAGRLAGHDVSITNAEGAEEGHGINEETLADCRSGSDSLLDSRRNSHRIRHLLDAFHDRLTHTNKLIFKSRIDVDFPDQSLEEIGMQIGVSKQRVKQIEDALKQRLVTYFKSNKVSPSALGIVE